MSMIWNTWPSSHYIGLQPWVWVQFESDEPPGAFPFLGGVDQDVVSALSEAHRLLQSAIETAISDVFAHRAPLDDPSIAARLEDAYAELVHSRPYLNAQIRCGRNASGMFQWDFPRDPSKSETITYTGLRIFNAALRQAIPLPFQQATAQAFGSFIGLLDGSYTVAEIKKAIDERFAAQAGSLSQFLESLQTYQCLSITLTSSIRNHWLRMTQDQDLVHLGHAALMYRQRDHFYLFDPWLLPWLAESPVPSLWTSLLPRPSAVFLTHDHDDHVDPRTLLMIPKDCPIIVPSRRNAKSLYYDYASFLRELGFSQVIELAHGETFPLNSGNIVSVPFYGEDPVDLELPRNCYLIHDRHRNVLVHADSGPTNSGKSAIKEGVIDDLVRRFGPIATVLASQQQLKELRTYAAYAPLSHPGTWLDVGENGYLTNEYLAQLAASSQARMFVSYATGGADWYPDHLSFMFHDRNPARTALLTAHWDRPEALKDLLAPLGCDYRYSHALDIYRAREDGGTDVVSSATHCSPVTLYRLDHGDPPFMRGRA